MTARSRRSIAEPFALLIAVWVIPCSLSVTPALAAEASLSQIVSEQESDKPLTDAPSAANKDLLELSAKEARQGDTIRVRLRPASRSLEEPVKLSFGDQKIPMFREEDGNLVALLAVPVPAKPGGHTITAGGARAVLEVVDAGYPVRRLRLPKKKNNFKASPGEKEAIKKAKLSMTPERLWSGAMIKPVKNYKRISSRFGIRRIVNGKLLPDYFHTGTDFAARTGTPVRACGAGKVVVAARGWRLHGNTVCIDHGHGVVSIYIHMNSVKVKQGDTVKAGQAIGAVGQTGRASGPHLHFGIYVNNVASNPEYWFKKVL